MVMAMAMVMIGSGHAQGHEKGRDWRLALCIGDMSM